MIETPLRVLLIEDDQDDYLLVRDYLGGTDDTTPRLEWAATYEAGRAALARREHDIALIDYQLGAHSGLDLLRAADGTSDLPPTILLTATSDAAIDAAAQTAGAFDSLIKGQLNALTLERSIRYTLDQSRQRVALAKSQQFLQATLDTLSAHIAVLDERGVIIAVNAAWRRFGAENASSDARYGVGLDYLAVCDAGAEDPDAAAVAAGIRALLAGHEEPFEREYPCHGPTERRWFAVRATRFAADGPARVIVAHENVSACKVAEERTRTQTQLLDQVEAAVIATDPAGIVTYWNAHATTLYGWTPAEALGQPIHDLTVGPADPAVTAAIWTQLRAGQSWAGEFMARNQSGTTFPAHGTDAPFQDADGHLAGIVGVSVDISERKRADDALRASERDFRGLLEQAADAIFIFAPDGHFLTVNARACALTGYERAELLACAVADIMPPEEADAISARVAELAAGPRTRERLVRRKDGTLIPSEVSAALLDDGRVQIIIRDNTARKAAEQALIVSEGRYRLLMEQASDGIVVMDTAGQFLEASAQMCAMLGYTHEELLRLSSSAVIAPADLAGRPLVVPAPGAERVVFERLVRRKDGTTLPVEASVKRLPDGRVQSIVRDITERQAAAVALHAQHTFTAAIADSLGEGVYAVDTAGRLTFLNPAAERLLGWSQAELLGQDMHATIHSHHEDGSPFPQEDCPLLGVLHTGIPYRAEEDHFVRRDGTTFPVTYTSAPICSADEVTGAVLAFQDITARKVAEAELREREEQFRYLFARNPHPMWVYDSVTLAFLEVNEAAITHYGYTRDEFLAMTLVDIRPLDQIEQLRALCPGARADGSVPGTWQHRTKDGRTIAVEIAVRALEYGGRLARLAVVQDVTARAAVEDALRASEARFRALVQQLGDVIAIADAQGIMRYASPAIEATLGYTPAAFVGISRYSYVHPDDHAAVGATFARALAEPGVPVAVTYRAHHRDGSWRWI
jgi:PAS domain S-box-containing protein